MNAGQTTATRGRLARMMTRALAVAALTLATLTATAVAVEAQQPPAKCRVLFYAQSFEAAGTSGEKMAIVVVTTTVSKCRGKLVVTRTSTRWLPGPR